MKKSSFKFLFTLPILIGLFSCDIKVNKGLTEQHFIEYSDEEVDKNSLNKYFLDNEDVYPSYRELKKNQPYLLDHVRVVESSNFFANSFQILRFSQQDNGFLNGETFIYINDNYFHLGGAFGGYGVTEFVRRQGDAGRWLYFIYSYGSGIHRTELRVFDLIHLNLYSISNLSLTSSKDYTFVLDNSDNTIDLYEASITCVYDDELFDTHIIQNGELVVENIDDMTKIHEK